MQIPFFNRLLKVATQIIFFLALVLFTTTANAQEPSDHLESGRYTAIESITLNGRTIPTGAEVEVLGILDVDFLISPSGRIATLRYGNELLNLDAALFQRKDVSNFDYRPLRFVTDGDLASVCTTLFNTQTRENIDIASADLEQFIRLSAESGAAPQVSFSKSNNYDSYSRSRSDFCINGLAYGTEYSITFLRGLPATDGPRNFALQTNFLARFKTPDREPVIRISAAQNILPTTEDTVIPVTAINVDTLKVTVHHVDLRSVANYNDVFGSLNSYAANRLGSFWGAEIAEREVQLDFPKNTENTFNLSLADLVADPEAGLYAISFGYEGQSDRSWEVQATQWIMVSDVSSMLFHGIEFTDIYLKNFTTAEALSEINVEIIASNNRVLAQAITDAAGSIRVPNTLLSGSGGFAPAFMIAHSDVHGTSVWELNDLDEQPRALAGGRNKSLSHDVYLSASRELYRSGDTIEAVGFARMIDLDALPEQEYNVVLERFDGTEVFSDVVKTDAIGAFRISIPLPASALLGSYRLKVLSLDDVNLAAQSLRVEDYVPLTIEPKIELGAQMVRTGETALVTLSAEYFSGGAAAGLSGEILMSLREAVSPFGEDYAEFTFGVPSVETSIEATSEELLLDDAGQAQTTFQATGANMTPAVYEYVINGTVFDVGGRANTTQTTLLFDSHSSYVGLRSLFGARLEEGSAPSFEVINLDRSGAETDISGTKFTLARVQYRWDWYWSEGWRYRSARLSDQILETGDVVGKNITARTGLDWGSYELRVTNADDFTTVHEFYVGWGAQSGPTTEPETLELAVSGVGIDGQLRFESPFAGTLNLHLAAGDILSSIEVPAAQGQNQVAVDLSDLPEPGGHILASIVRPIESGSEHLPQVAIGTVWVPSLSDERIIPIDVALRSQVRSDEEITIDLSLTQEGGTAVIFLVDDGIHAVTGYQNRDLLQHYLGERALGIGFQSNFGQLISQDASLPTLRVGGDGEARIATSVDAERSEFFKTYVQASPLLTLINGQASYTFPKAEMEGRLRAVAFAATATGFGFETREIIVQDPVSLDISLPRFIAPGDIIGGKIAIRSNDFTGDFVLRKYIGTSRDVTELTISSGQSFTTSIPLSTDQLGRVPVTIEAVYGGRTVRYEFEIVSRSPSYPLTELRSTGLNGSNLLGWSRTQVEPIPTETFTNFDTNVTLSASLGASEAQILASLDRYPYGCVEQTSSSVRGLIARAEYGGLTPDLSHKINVGINGLLAKQQFSGAFGYWNRNDLVVERYQPYAIETLIMALPYATDRDTVTMSISNGLEYLYRSDFDDVEVQLYAYGILASSGYEVTSRARYAIDNNLNLSQIDRNLIISSRYRARGNLDRLSLAYWVASTLNDTARMQHLSSLMLANLADGERLPVTAFLTEPEINSPGNWQAPALRTTPSYSRLNQMQWWLAARRYGYLLASLPAGHQTEATERVLDLTKSFLERSHYRSTIDNARLLRILQAANDSIDGLKVFVDGERVAIGMNGELELSDTQITSGFEIRHNGSSALQLVSETSGTRSSFSAVSNGYIVTKHIYNSDGHPVEPFGFSTSEHLLFTAKQGELFTVVIDIDHANRERLDDLLLTDLLPSGFELENSVVSQPKIFDNDGNLVELDIVEGLRPSFRQNMDDRFVAHFRGEWRSNTFATVTYTMRAAYETEAAVPDAHVEHMYAPEVNGRSNSSLVLVARR
ncbi:MG2 domain-containing protein [bacterium]|nr:MG2 domain-containing protein [bacterium]